jgi:hypothetical protein
MKTHKVKVASLTPIASRRERAIPVVEKLKGATREYELIELDFTGLETVGAPFFDQIATSSAAEGKLDRIVFVIREDYIQNLKFVSKHRRLAIRYRLENEAEIKKIEEPPPLQEPEPTRADIEELPPSPYDPNPKEIF